MFYCHNLKNIHSVYKSKWKNTEWYQVSADFGNIEWCKNLLLHDFPILVHYTVWLSFVSELDALYKYLVN